MSWDGWELTPNGKPLLQGLTRVRTSEYGPNVALRLDWEGPVEGRTQTSGQVQIVLSREGAFELGQELLRLSGLASMPEPKGRA
jgi:hypothetical protein